MKKGLLSILAGALVVVGCQNYDDQFNNLESQISALASTVAGLSQVQSDLSALAGTVSSLSSTVNGLGSAIDTAVSDGLADIQADIDAIESAVADVASSDEVAALQEAVDASQEDLSDLLAASSVFTGDVVVNSAQTLDAYHKMGAGLNIVNGNVNITVSTDMDQAKVQELVDNILTTVKDFTYTSAASTIAETTFENLTGTRSLTITQGGGMRFPNLVSATNIYLKDDFESTVEVIHFGSLTSVAGIDTDSEENTIRFTKATEVHLTSLAYYPPATLTIETDEGAALPLAIDDLDSDGDELEDGITLSIKGPASVAISNIADGSITLEDVASATLTDFKGSVTLTGDVTSFTSNSLVKLTVSSGAGVETIDVTGVSDPDAEDGDDANYYGPAIDLDTLGDLETVTIAGIAESVNVGSNNNLTDVTISADVAGNISIDDNSDLTNVTLTGAKAASLDVVGNADLETLTVDLTWRAGTATDDVVDGDLDVTGNASLQSLTVSSNNIEDLTVTGNAELATLDFTGVDAIGATGEADVDIWNNDLTATKLTDLDDGTTNVANGATGDKGKVTSDSGMSTLKDYLEAVEADADSAANVYFDTVESFVDEDDDETTDITYSTNTAENATTVLLLVAKDVSTAAKDATRHRHVLAIANTATATFDIFIADNSGSITTSLMDAAATHNANEDLYIDEIVDETNLSRADAYGVTLAAYKGAFPTGIINFQSSVLTATADNSSTGADPKVSVAHVVSTTDVVNLTVDGVLLSGTVLALDALDTAGNNSYDETSIVAPTIDELIEIVANAWQETYVLAAATSETVSLFKVNSDTGNDQLDITAKSGTGRRGYDKSYSFTVTAASSTLASAVYGVYYGATTASADNKTISNGVIVTVEADTGGYILDETKGLIFQANLGASTQTATTDLYAGFQLGTTTLLANAGTNLTSSTDVHPDEARGDAVKPEAEVAEVADAATDFSRVGWL